MSLRFLVLRRTAERPFRSFLHSHNPRRSRWALAGWESVFNVKSSLSRRADELIGGYSEGGLVVARHHGFPQVDAVELVAVVDLQARALDEVLKGQIAAPAELGAERAEPFL